MIVNHAFGKIFNMIYRIFWVRFLRDTTRIFIVYKYLHN